MIVKLEDAEPQIQTKETIQALSIEQVKMHDSYADELYALNLQMKL